MATAEEKECFPIRNIDDLLGFVKIHLERNEYPNLSLISIILGCVENSLTCNRKGVQEASLCKTNTYTFPPLELSKVEALYQKFVVFVKGLVDSTKECGQFTSRETVKLISDVIWSGLTSNYTDKAHLQTLYSYLTGSKLDCFGVSLAVAAASQILGCDDVHLSLSEDHAWVVFGEEGKETAEVTWHGKGVEDRRGQPIPVSRVSHSWLYLNNHAVICNRHVELAAIFSSINPAINSTTDSTEMARLQQRLLWMMYDLGHLDRYPMALGTLGDLEELEPTDGRPYCEEIYKQAVSVNRHYYNNHHVYPYTYLGAFYYRQGRYKQALRNWAEAAEVISQYNYSRDDEEIYKEFLEIAHELIPQIVRFASDGYLIGSMHHKTAKVLEGLTKLDEKPSALVSSINEHEPLPFLKDPENYEMILRFYDGICEWEEGSNTPVLHITWAKHFTFCLSKFDGSMRNGIKVERESGDSAIEDSDSSDSDSEVDREDENENKKRKSPLKTTISSTLDSQASGDHTIDESKPMDGIHTTESLFKSENTNCCESEQIKIKDELPDVSKGDTEEDTESNIADLAKDCADFILNPDFLLGKGEPFTTSVPTSLNTTVTQSRPLTVDLKSSSLSENPKQHADLIVQKRKSRISTGSKIDSPWRGTVSMGVGTRLQFRSAKMKGLKDLLTSERLNTSAINLQMTAQSQVSLKHSKVASTYDQAVPRKRTRRSEPM